MLLQAVHGLMTVEVRTAVFVRKSVNASYLVSWKHLRDLLAVPLHAVNGMAGNFLVSLIAANRPTLHTLRRSLESRR